MQRNSYATRVYAECVYHNSFKTIRELRDGWQGDGCGISFDRSFLDSVQSEFFDILKANNISIPYVFPTVDGHLSFEWIDHSLINEMKFVSVLVKNGGVNPIVVRTLAVEPLSVVRLYFNDMKSSKFTTYLKNELINFLYQVKITWICST